MSKFTDKIEEELQITTKYHGTYWVALSEKVSPTGFGNSEIEAKYDLITKALSLPTQRPNIIKTLNKPIGESSVIFSLSFEENYCTITAIDEYGKEKSIKIKIKGTKNAN